MKKFLSLFGLLIVLGITSCSDDECDHNFNSKPTGESSILGTWYVETENEEINYDYSGTFYDRYSNVRLSGETEGRFEFNQKAMRLTYRYTYLGQNVTADWTVSDLSEFSFKISSETSIGNLLEKIVVKDKLKVGENVSLVLPPELSDLNVYSYSSNNELIATVSSDGTVTATGGKGTNYIKMNTPVGNLWAKITVGDDNKDLWCDYSTIIGADYKTMTDYFSSLGKPASDGIDYYVYPLSVHGYLRSVNVLMDIEKEFVSAIQLFINEGVPPIEIKTYLKARYYEHESLGIYSIFPEIEDSKVILSYDQENRCVTYFDTQTVLHPELWYDFTKLFGLDKNEVKAAMEKQGYPFLMSDSSYSKDGSEYYEVTENNFVTLVGFVFNPDKEVSQIWLYMNTKSDANEVYYYLSYKYQEDKSESTDYKLVFYNNNKTLKVVFDLMSAAVIYTDLTMKQHEANNEILGSYYDGLGMTHDQIIAQYGSPFSDDGSMLMYIIGSIYINLAAFTIDSDTDLCKYAMITINEAVSESTILDYLNSKYTVFNSNNTSGKTMYAWINGPSIGESTMGIIYYPDDRMVIYQLLGSATKSGELTGTSLFDMDNQVLKKISSKSFEFRKNNNFKKNFTKKGVEITRRLDNFKQRL